MHRWDVESSVGQRSAIDADFATDGIDGLFHTFTRMRESRFSPVPFASSPRTAVRPGA
ncbi:MAG TPA: hypothetical protein VHL52_05225 [Acidimicrobiia bacterium]|nr:hypothetical protein [Acidimicrobiia bacterium]